MSRFILFEQIIEQFNVGLFEFKLARLLFFDYLNDSVIDGSGNAAFSAPFADNAVDCINLAGLTVAKVLKH